MSFREAKNRFNFSGDGRWILSILSIFFLSISMCPALFGQEPLRKQFIRRYYDILADSLFNSREIPTNLERALRYYQKANALYQSTGIDWKITRVYWALAQRSATKQERYKFHSEGIKYGILAIKRDNANSDAHLWYSIVLGSRALDMGIMKAIYDREKIKRGFKTALKLNPENTNAMIGLASWYYYVPTVLGGNRKEAYRLVNKALAARPNYTKARMTKVEFLMEEKRYGEASRELKNVVETRHPDYFGDSVENKSLAKKLLKRLSRQNLSQNSLNQLN